MKREKWQTQLIAMSICMKQNKGKLIKEKTEKIYKNLLEKENKK